MGATERKPLIEQIEQKRGSRLLCCLTSDRDNAQGAIAKDFLYRFYLHLKTMPDLEKLDVLFFTYGGDTLAAYALSRFVRQYAKHIAVLVPHMCLSGGTLFALGADEIFMTRLGVLSAIDPSINGPLNPLSEIQMAGVPGVRLPVPVGVESIAGFQKFVAEDWKLGDQGKDQAFSLLAQRVNPVLLGDLKRSKEQIVNLATSLMKLHVKQMDSEQIGKSVEILASKLGSHDYLISAPEARDVVKLHIAPEDRELEALVLALYEDFAAEMELGVPFDIQAIFAQQQGQPAPITKLIRLVVVESSGRSDVWEREMVLIPPGQVLTRKNFWR